MGVPGSTAQKNSLDNVFLVLGLFYSLQRWSNGFIAENYTFQRIERGANIFQWGPTFSRGGGGDPNANFYLNPYNL